MKKFFFYCYKFCNLLIAEESGAVCRAAFCDNKGKMINNKTLPDFVYSETSLIKNAAKQLDEYFNKKRKDFNFPLVLHGTDFQVDVWKALQQIPYGETRSYGEIAAAIGRPKASRAAGMANNRNPIVIIVPCHRVIGGNGNLVGYAGGLDLKQKLLEIEKN